MEKPIARPEKTLRAIAELLGAKDPEVDVAILGLTNSSSQVEVGDLFLAFPGAKVHGAMFCMDARGRGARGVLTDSAGAELAVGLPAIVVENPRRAAGILSAWFFGEPMRDMFAVGITGTNGKTTTTTLLHQIWTYARREAGLIGTVETRIGKDVIASKRTTPESADLQTLIATMRERHVKNLAMEVSSHAISLERVRGAHFSAVAFSNLSQDHLDFHGSMEEYFETKAALFTFEYADLAVINVDDPYGKRLALQCELPILQLSRQNPKADWSYVAINSHPRGNDVVIRGLGGVLVEGTLPLHGDFNLDNALMAIALAYESGVDPVEISALLPRLTGAPGRLEPVDLGQGFAAFVDYAHSPDSVVRVLRACREMSAGKVIAVLGCGGDRDSSKRPLMGHALAEGSDIAIFTSDNPRSEDPLAILQEMTKGLEVKSPNRVILDRRQAIEYAVSVAGANDIVIILGKGHEIGQEISGTTTPFDDRLVLAEVIETRA